MRRKEFEARPADATRSLLELIGKNYEGSMPIQTISQSQSRMNTAEMTQLQSQVQTLQGRIDELEGGQTRNSPRDSHAQSAKSLPPISSHVDSTHISQNPQGKEDYAKDSIETPVSADAPRTIEFYERACAEQNGKACTNLGLLYYQGLGIPQNLQRAQFYFDQGCRYRNKVACVLRKSSP